MLGSYKSKHHRETPDLDVKVSLLVSAPDFKVCAWGAGQGSPRLQQAILEHKQGVQELNSVLTLSTRRQNQIPQVEGSGLQACSFPQVQTQVVTCTSDQ